MKQCKESTKFRANAVQKIGFVFCTPVALKLLAFLLDQISLNEFLNFTSALSLILFIIGVLIFNRSLDILFEEEMS